MKKSVLTFVLGTLLSFSAVAQNSEFTLNTRAWSTNYWTTIIYDVVTGSVKYFVFDDEDDRTVVSRIIPSADLVFPVGIQKEGFGPGFDIFGPYHRAFSNPFTKIGDFGVGLDASWRSGLFGIYAGAYFKSQEVCFENLDNLRGFYAQPRAGILLGRDNCLEAGVYYDIAVAAGGHFPMADKDMIGSGLGLDFALSHSTGDHYRSILSFMLPLHNFFNEDFAGGAFKGLKRRVGYIMLTHRIKF